MAVVNGYALSHYVNTEGWSFCGMQETPAERIDRPSDRPSGNVCPACAYAMYAALAINAGEHMALESEVGESISDPADLITAIEQGFGEGFIAVVERIRYPQILDYFTERQRVHETDLGKRASLLIAVVPELREWADFWRSHNTKRLQDRKPGWQREPPISKINVIKAVRQAAMENKAPELKEHIGLKEAKDVVELFEMSMKGAS